MNEREVSLDHYVVSLSAADWAFVARALSHCQHATNVRASDLGIDMLGRWHLGETCARIASEIEANVQKANP